MACPKCGCKVHYQYDNGWDEPQNSERERCAACRHVFYAEDAADDDDDDADTRDLTRAVNRRADSRGVTR